MLELLTSVQGGGNNYYPNSGPGTKTLTFGDERLGYFGEVTQKEMLGLPELRRQLDYWGGADASGVSQFGWIKMLLDGKVLFIPKQALATGVSWDELYNKGLIYGTDDNGAVPGATPTNQLRVAIKSTSQFKVRAFKARTTDPVAHDQTYTIAAPTPLPDIAAIEWVRIVQAITNEARIINYTGPSWNIYAKEMVLLPAGPGFAVAQNTRINLQNQHATVGNSQLSLGTKAAASYLWLPVLELLDTPVYLAHSDVAAAGMDVVAPVVVQELEYDSGYQRHLDFTGNAIQPVLEAVITSISYE